MDPLVWYLACAVGTAWFSRWLDGYTNGRILGEHRSALDGPLVVACFWPIFLPLYLAAFVRVWHWRRHNPGEQ